MNRIAWHHAFFEVPPDWEVTAYSIERRQGRLELSTRHGLQGSLMWSRCKRAPDVKAMVLPFLERLVSAKVRDLAPALQTRSVGHFTLTHVPGYPCQALRFLPEEKTLLHWVFEWTSDDVIERVVEPVLHSVEPNGGDPVSYCMHGLNLRLPSHYEIEQMHVFPANVMITFESNKNKARAVFRRWGMPELVLQGRTLAKFHPWLLRAAGATVTEVHASKLRGMPGAALKFSQRGVHQMDKFLGRQWDNGEGRLWLNEEEQRLYAFEQIGPPGVELLKFEEAVKHV